jgi:hypothetical protein
MVIIQQQGGFRTSYDQPASLCALNCGDNQRNGLNTVWRLGLMLRVRKRPSGPVMSNGRNDAAMSAEGLFQVEPVK